MGTTASVITQYSLTIQSTGCTVRGLNPGRNKIFFVFPNVQTGSEVHPDSYSVGTGILSRDQRGRGVKFITQLRLLPMLRMSGAIPLLPLYAFMVWTAKILPLPLPFTLLYQMSSCQLSGLNTVPKYLLLTVSILGLFKDAFFKRTGYTAANEMKVVYDERVMAYFMTSFHVRHKIKKPGTKTG